MESWILNEIMKNKNKSNKKEMEVFKELIITEFGKEILIEVFKIGFVKGYETNNC